MDEPRRMRLIDNPNVAGPVVGEGRDYITIENETTEHVTRSPEAFEPAPPAEPAPGTLTERQIKALDWILQVCIEHTAEQAPGLEPDQAVEEICDLASVVELLPPGEVHDRLSNLCEEIRREQQVRLDQTLAQEEAEQTTEQKLRAAIKGLLEVGTFDKDDDPLVQNARDVMPPLYPTEEQARRYLTLWQIQSARKDRAAIAHWGAKAAEYLPHLSPDVAAELRAEFGFTQETAS